MQPAIVEDSRDKFIKGATKALAMRVGLKKRDPGNEFAGQPMHELARMSLQMAGLEYHGLTRNQLTARVFAAHTSSDFPQIMSNVAGKVLREAYSRYPNTYQQIAYVGSVTDFKVNPRIQLGSFNSLDTIPEGGEYKYGKIEEEHENIQATTKGKAIALTRQMIVNDDLDAFKRISTAMGRAAARTVNTDLYTLITSGANNRGPNSSDGGQFFNDTAATSAGGHANLVASGSGAAPSVTTVSAGRNAMRKQKDKGLNEVLGILPSVLLAPVGMEDAVWTLINSTTDVSQSNPKKKNYVVDVARLKLVTDPFLDNVSATAWYLFADPLDAAAAFEIAFLDGIDEPYIEDMVDFDTDSMKFKVRLDYGIAPGDWRGGYRNEGA